MTTTSVRCFPVGRLFAGFFLQGRIEIQDGPTGTWVEVETVWFPLFLSGADFAAGRERVKLALNLEEKRR